MLWLWMIMILVLGRHLLRFKMIAVRHGSVSRLSSRARDRMMCLEQSHHPAVASRTDQCMLHNDIMITVTSLLLTHLVHSNMTQYLTADLQWGAGSLQWRNTDDSVVGATQRLPPVSTISSRAMMKIRIKWYRDIRELVLLASTTKVDVEEPTAFCRESALFLVVATTWTTPSGSSSPTSFFMSTLSLAFCSRK